MGDEAAARGALASMQERIARSAHDALGIPTSATTSDIRGAFLALTKQFHPQRFGRMSADVQKLANEVFLGIRAAHDSLKVATGRTTTSPGMPAIRMTTTGAMPALQRPTTMGMPPIRTPGNRTPTPAMGTPILPRRTPTPALGTPVLPTKNPTLPLPALEKKQTDADRVPKPTKPGVAQPAQTTDKSFPRIETQPGVSSRSVRTDRLDHRLDPSTTKPPAPSVAVAIDLLANRQWDAAKVALSALAAMAPDSQHVRALVFFASGRQAQLEHRLDEARIDLQRALQLDPDLAPAKAALAELFVRRK